MLLLGYSFRAISAVGAQPVPKKYEVRAVWLTTIHGLDWPKRRAETSQDVRRQTQELDELLDQLKAAGINTVYFQVRGRGDLVYPSKHEPLSPALFVSRTDAPYDALRYAVDACHSRGMRISAWLVTLPLGSNSYVKNLGKEAYARKHKDRCIYYNGEWFMDPADPHTDAHLIEICKEIACNYDIDGIHLDYIRYPDRSANFPDRAAYRRSGSKLTLEQWRRDNISRIVESVFAQLKMVNPELELSAAPIGRYRKLREYPKISWTALESVHQDPVEWESYRIMDALVPMLYFKDDDFYPFVMDWLSATKLPLIVGIGAYRMLPGEGGWCLEDIVKQIAYVQSDSLARGMSFFRAEHVIDPRLGIYRALRDSLFRRPALPLQGRDSLPSSDIKDLAVSAEKDSLVLSWKGISLYPHTYSIYVSQGIEVNALRDLTYTTQSESLSIPLEALKRDELIHVRVGIYRLRDGAETLTDEEVYYLTDSVK